MPPMEWLKDMARQWKKTPDQVDKKLNAYKLGYKAGGAIAGVQVIVNDDCCEAAQGIKGQVYPVDEVPRLPLEGCPYGEDCRCDYRPKMAEGTTSARSRKGK